LFPLLLFLSLHICVTARHAGRAADLLRDLREAVAEVKSTPSAHGGLAPMYGLAASLPDRSIISGFLYDFLDLVLKAPK
jgi:sphinganine-1-phosphate aldolase